MSADQETRNYDHVLIPVELNRQFSEFFSQLKMAILREAAQQVADRFDENGRCALQPSDVVAPGRKAIIEAASKFEQTFSGSDEFNHVKRAS